MNMIRDDVDRVFGRVKEFYTKPSGALIHITNIRSIKRIPERPLNSWDLPRGLTAYLDATLAQAETYWRQRAGIDDDLLPSVCPWFGVAEHTAFLGGEVKIEETTTFQLPILKDWNDFDSLGPSEERMWFRMLADGLEYLKEKARGRFFVRLRGAYGPMSVANAIRGNDFFYDIYDCPEATKKLVDFSTQSIEWYLERQRNIVGPLNGGYLTGFQVWMPGNSAGHIDEDSAALCSAETYRQFGLPYTAKLCSKYDNVILHLHGLGRHIIPDLVTIPQLSCIQLTKDPNCPDSMEVYREYADYLSGKIVMLDLSRKEIEDNYDFLKSRRTIILSAAEDPEEARTIIERVRSI